MFRILREPLSLPRSGTDGAGARVVFEGMVRNSHQGKAVARLEYEAFDEAAEPEGQSILDEAVAKFGLISADCVHRAGLLEIGELAVIIETVSPHRQAAYDASIYIIEELKRRVPVWKKEHYVDGESDWIGASAGDSLGFDEERYSRQTVLPDIGVSGQQKLAASHVVIVGAGALGCASLPMLSAAGVGRITVIDGDRVELSNLPRQTLFGDADLDRHKVHVACEQARRLNKELTAEPKIDWAHQGNCSALIEGADVVLDCTDSFEAAFALNDACVAAEIPLVHCAIHRSEIRALIVQKGMCLRCLWPDEPVDGCVEACDQAGVLGPCAGVAGQIQAWEAIKLITSGTSPLCSSLLIQDLDSHSSLLAAREPNHACPACSGAAIPASAVLHFEEIPKDWTLVDIRDEDEISESPVVGSQPLSEPLPPGPVLLLCEKGRRAAVMAAEIRKGGRTDVFALSGGRKRLQG